MKNRIGAGWRSCMVGLVTALLVACGGGGGGGGETTVDGGSKPAEPDKGFAKVQFSAAPAAEDLPLNQVSGIVSLASDPYDPAGRQSGVAVSLHEVQADGSLGAAQASGLTGANGSFALTLPTGRSSADGKWLLQARSPAGDIVLRAYAYPGAVRLDVSSEAWVRQVQLSAGRLLGFAPAASGQLRDIARSLGLFTDSIGRDYADATPGQVPDRILGALQHDAAWKHLTATLRSGGVLPAAGVGDIGSFFVLSNSYAAEVVDATGASTLVTRQTLFGRPEKSSDGNWAFKQELSKRDGKGEWAFVPGGSSEERITPDRWLVRLPGDDANMALLSGVIGEYAQQSWPIRPGSRRLMERRFENSGINFTGGTESQPFAFAATETVSNAIELLTVGGREQRVLRVVNDAEITMPAAAGAVKRLVLRSTAWLVPGAGPVKVQEEALENGVSQATEVLTFSRIHAEGRLWPNRISFGVNGAGARSNCATPIPGTRRYLVVEPGEPLVGGTPRLALSLMDMDSLQRIGSQRVFAGNASGACPVLAGNSGAVFVVETFSERSRIDSVATDSATATALSDVVHVVSGADLSDLASYRIAAVPDDGNPAAYWPASVVALTPAPDASMRFLLTSVRSSYGSSLYGAVSRHAQVLGPGVSSARTRFGDGLVVGGDWLSGQLLSWSGRDPLTLSTMPFSVQGVEPGASRVIKAGFNNQQVWYVSAAHVHLTDGTTLRVADGSQGPSLLGGAGQCGQGQGLLVCLDWRNDQLVRYDPATLARISVLPLASELRAVARSGPDFRRFESFLSGIQVLDRNTVVLDGHEVRIGAW